MQIGTELVDEHDDAARWPKCNHRALELDPFELVMAPSDPNYPNEGVLQIFELSANHLAAQDWLSGKSDPYVALYLVDEDDNAISNKLQTDVIKNTLNPEWNSFFSLDVQSKEGAFLVAEIWDFNAVKSSDFLGRVKLPLLDLKNGHHNFNLSGLLKSGAPATGHLFMTTQFVERGDIEPAQSLKQNSLVDSDLQLHSEPSPRVLNSSAGDGHQHLHGQSVEVDEGNRQLSGAFRWALRGLEVGEFDSDPPIGFSPAVAVLFLLAIPIASWYFSPPLLGPSGFDISLHCCPGARSGRHVLCPVLSLRKPSVEPPLPHSPHRGHPRPRTELSSVAARR